MGSARRNEGVDLAFEIKARVHEDRISSAACGAAAARGTSASEAAAEGR